MAQVRVLNVTELSPDGKKTVKAGETEILLIRLQSGPHGGLIGVQAKCPHAGAPLEKGALCNGRLVCPWHMGTFALPGGELLEPPPMEPLKTYAVEVRDEEIYVDPEPLPAVARSIARTTEHPVILLAGVGAAGAMAAATLRQSGFAGRIVAVDPIADEPVDRTQLSKQALAGKMPLEKVSMDLLGDLAVERVQASLASLNAADGVARLSTGESIRFDSALLATGGTPKRLTVPGAELAYTIRHTDDVRKILAAADGKQTAVVVGTSFIGLEAASALTQKGLQVTVVGREELPFAKQFGEEVARAVKALHQANGTSFRLGVEIVSITPAGVTVRTDGKQEVVPGELVVMGVGVEPELGFEHDLPLAEQGGGIRADDSLHAAGRVWVAGDIANVDGTRIEHWRLAEQHGRVAALAMLATDDDTQVRYEGVPFFWTFHHGKRLGYLGHAKGWDEIVTEGDVQGLDFVAFYVKAGQVQAVLSCGRDTQTSLLAERMREKPTLEQARAAIA